MILPRFNPEGVLALPEGLELPGSPVDYQLTGFWDRMFLETFNSTEAEHVAIYLMLAQQQFGQWCMVTGKVLVDTINSVLRYYREEERKQDEERAHNDHVLAEYKASLANYHEQLMVAASSRLKRIDVEAIEPPKIPGMWAEHNLAHIVDLPIAGGEHYNRGVHKLVEYGFVGSVEWDDGYGLYFTPEGVRRLEKFKRPPLELKQPIVI